MNSGLVQCTCVVLLTLRIIIFKSRFYKWPEARQNMLRGSSTSALFPVKKYAKKLQKLPTNCQVFSDFFQPLRLVICTIYKIQRILPVWFFWHWESWFSKDAHTNDQKPDKICWGARLCQLHFRNFQLKLRLWSSKVRHQGNRYQIRIAVIPRRVCLLFWPHAIWRLLMKKMRSKLATLRWLEFLCLKKTQHKIVINIDN